MHSLPYELLKIIVDEVPNHQDLLRIRLVNTTFRALATPRVFRWFRVCGTAQNANAINEIARHETLAGCIQGIVFPVDHSKSEFHLTLLRLERDLTDSASEPGMAVRNRARHCSIYLSPQSHGTQDVVVVISPMQRAQSIDRSMGHPLYDPRPTSLTSSHFPLDSQPDSVP